MKYFPAGLVLALTLAGCSTTEKSAQAAPASAPGEVLALIVVGEMPAVDAAGQHLPVHRGDFLQEGATLVTAGSSGATFVFSNGVTLRLKENRQLRIRRFEQAPYDQQAEGTFLRPARDPSRSKTALDLQKGTAQGEVKQLNEAAGSTFQINFPGGSKQGAGTFDVSA